MKNSKKRTLLREAGWRLFGRDGYFMIHDRFAPTAVRLMIAWKIYMAETERRREENAKWGKQHVSIS